MQIVYILQHERVISEYNDDVKLIGAFSSQKTAEAAIEQLKKQPGFCDTPEGFSIGKYPIDEINWSQGYVDDFGDEEE